MRREVRIRERVKAGHASRHVDFMVPRSNSRVSNSRISNSRISNSRISTSQYSMPPRTILPTIVRRLAAVVLAAMATGCGGGSEPGGGSTTQPQAAARPAPSPVADNAPPPDPAAAGAPPQQSRRTFAEMAAETDWPGGEADPAEERPAEPSRPGIDDERLAAVGIRKIPGRHLTLYTDLPSDPQIDDLPASFDAAVPLWAAYFEIEAARTDDWHVAGSLMQNKERFQRAGLLPDDLPPFLHGFQQGYELWLYEQPSAYYRRHLLLHEGVHAFMKHFLGGAGPPWYMEGTAELLATHSWDEGRLTLPQFPRSRESTAHWGRIKIIQDDVKAGKGKSLEDVFRYDERAHLNVEPYAW